MNSLFSSFNNCINPKQMFFILLKCQVSVKLSLFKIFLILFFYFTILYWFCHTSTCIRHGCTHVPILNPPPSPYHPSRSSQCTSSKPPLSCIEPGLVIHFLYKSNTKGLALFISASSIINRTELYIPDIHIVFSFSSYLVSVNHNKN